MKIGNEVGRLTKMIKKTITGPSAIPVADVGHERNTYQDGDSSNAGDESSGEE